jgi:hypothetical protein
MHPPMTFLQWCSFLLLAHTPVNAILNVALRSYYNYEPSTICQEGHLHRVLILPSTWWRRSPYFARTPNWAKQRTEALTVKTDRHMTAAAYSDGHKMAMTQIANRCRHKTATVKQAVTRNLQRRYPQRPSQDCSIDMHRCRHLTATQETPR